MEPQREGQHIPPSDTDSNTCTISRHFLQFANGRPPGQGHRKPPARFLSLKLLNFYFGVTLSLCGVGAFVTGASSSKWVEVEVSDPAVDVGGLRLQHHHRMLSHFGPWAACTYGKHCGQPWTVAPGLDKSSVRGTQCMLLLAILTYLVGATIVVLQLLRPRCVIERCPSLLTTALAEALFPIAAVLSFLSMLMMGELKRKLILQVTQTSSPGWAFVVCLAAVLATVLGDVCMIFNRKRISSWLTSPCVEQRCEETTRKGERTSRGQGPPESVQTSHHRSDIHVATRDVLEACDVGSPRHVPESASYCASDRGHNETPSINLGGDAPQASLRRRSVDDRTVQVNNQAMRENLVSQAPEKSLDVRPPDMRHYSDDEVALKVAALPARSRDMPPFFFSVQANQAYATGTAEEHAGNNSVV